MISERLPHTLEMHCVMASPQSLLTRIPALYSQVEGRLWPTVDTARFCVVEFFYHSAILC
jgi:hypothetical protein